MNPVKIKAKSLKCFIPDLTHSRLTLARILSIKIYGIPEFMPPFQGNTLYVWRDIEAQIKQ
jgi:hypothetical protein